MRRDFRNFIFIVRGRGCQNLKTQIMSSVKPEMVLRKEVQRLLGINSVKIRNNVKNSIWQNLSAGKNLDAMFLRARNQKQSSPVNILRQDITAGD